MLNIAKCYVSAMLKLILLSYGRVNTGGFFESCGNVKNGFNMYPGLFQQFWEKASGQNWEKMRLNIEIVRN